MLLTRLTSAKIISPRQVLALQRACGGVNASSQLPVLEGAVRWLGTTIQKTSHGEPEVASSLSEKDFHVLADNTLDEIVDRLGVLDDCPALEENEDELDVNYSMGVMNIILGQPHGTWVINKQTPNRQLWWSSPISGPRRYELTYDEEKDSLEDMQDEDPLVLARRWKATKQEPGDVLTGDLLHDLRDELHRAVGVDILEDE